eukprot:CAMPEP_0174356978 /NCGR_PEP_ID=MMETSP0811_2-20130205/33143_1 /TAXON_ID=73025 ORGANISM="Eutreptiella gymnastica-like, Strain CCMP1594" /NCGR_SAMPLE_ID=MMETSP0811_2 /ASSEMBLY_ACC=CAM_ASM_000667 /LENGTH=99 /DNA_ID=CAMNT_0015489361 /DNA_START=213 /DNA_END=509 /DNA_ORIENTATION=+
MKCRPKGERGGSEEARRYTGEVCWGAYKNCRTGPIPQLIAPLIEDLAKRMGYRSGTSTFVPPCVVGMRRGRGWRLGHRGLPPFSARGLAGTEVRGLSNW